MASTTDDVHQKAIYQREGRKSVMMIIAALFVSRRLIDFFIIEFLSKKISVFFFLLHSLHMYSFLVVVSVKFLAMIRSTTSFIRNKNRIARSSKTLWILWHHIDETHNYHLVFDIVALVHKKEKEEKKKEKKNNKCFSPISYVLVESLCVSELIWFSWIMCAVCVRVRVHLNSFCEFLLEL